MQIFTNGRETEYVPRSERGKTNPPHVVIKYSSNASSREAGRDLADEVGQNKNPAALNKALLTLQREKFIKHVVGLHGFKDDDGKKVTDIGWFYDNAPTALVEEILIAMEDCRRLSEGQLKNFEGVSDSGTAAPNQDRSTAESAGEKTPALEIAGTPEG